MDREIAQRAAKESRAKTDSRHQMHRLAEWLMDNEPHLMTQGIRNDEVVRDIVIRLLDERKLASDASL